MPNTDKYGPPAMQCGSFRLWVHGRAFPEATDGWDSNWLRLTAHYSEMGGSVLISGALLDTVSVFRWHAELEHLYRELRGKAVLESVEPNLRVLVEARGGTGKIDVRVEITPDHMTQGHWFEDTIDQTFLPPLINQCERVLREYPVRPSR